MLKIKSLILFLILIFFGCNTLRGEEWNVVKANGEGEITVFYYNSDNFISDASGKLKGIEYDIFLAFQEYLSKEGVNLKIKFKKADSFLGLYDQIKFGGSGDFGACSFSMTAKRMKEISFSPKYMPDIEVLINSSNIGVAENEEEFIALFSSLIALNVPNTTFEEDLNKLKATIPQLKIEDVETASIIRERILSEKNVFGYIELPTYLKLFKNGLRFKRQNLFKVERNGYGIILPKNSSWLTPVNAFFNSEAFKVEVNEIIKKHLGKGVNDLLWKIEDSESSKSQSEISLLTMERETQEMEIEQQVLKVQILIGGGAFILIIFLLLLYGYRIKKTANESLHERNSLIEKQKSELERLSIVAEKMNEAVIISDPNGKIEYYNDSLLRHFGYTTEEFELRYKNKMYLQKITSRTDLQEIIDGFKTDSTTFLYDSQHLKKDGSAMWTSASLSPVYDKERKLFKIIVVYTDIYERKAFANQLAEKNKEITDSINYAKMIQDALLPSESILKNLFEDYFIVFKPKDIVSGDFYWFENLQEYCLLVLADCTGHGVPGAFMSMMGSNFLTNIITDKGITSTSKALAILDEKVKTALESENHSSRDGMDIVFMAFNKKTNQLTFSGGNNSIFILREKELIQYKGDRFSIGFDGLDNKSFREESIDLQAGDTIYTFTDGYKDQFGGPKGRKYMQKRLLETIKANGHLGLSDQKLILENNLMEWMKNHNQVDDISVMAFKV